MADEMKIELAGVDELKRALAAASSSIRTKAVRFALRDAGKVIQAAARIAAPVLAVPTKTRTPGTVRRNIVVRASKFSRQAGDEGVYVNVRGIRGRARVKRFGKSGAANPNDPYYWRFLELGTSKMAARSFLRPAAENKGAEAIAKFMQSVIPQIEKLNNKARPT